MNLKQIIALSILMLTTLASFPVFGDDGRYSDDDWRRDDQGGAVFVMTNDAEYNEIIMYLRSPDGTLKSRGRFPTGGRGSGLGKTIGIDPLGSQNALILDEDGKFLYAANAGDDTITTFRVKKRYLKYLGSVPSGGRFPVSLAVQKRIVYVLNAGANDGLGGAAPANITGFRRKGRRLFPIEGSTRSLIDVPQNPTDPDSDYPNILATPAQIQFSPSADSLVVTIKDALNAANSSIWVFDVDKKNNYLTGESPSIFPTAGPVPFGFMFDAWGRLLVTDAGAGTVSSYDLDDGAIAGPIGSVETGQAATCWIVGTGGRWKNLVYTANTGSGTLSGYRVLKDGSLSETGIFPVGANAQNIDLAITRDGKFIYTQNGGLGTVSVYRVKWDGTLNLVDETDAVEPVSGFQGIAAW